MYEPFESYQPALRSHAKVCYAIDETFHYTTALYELGLCRSQCCQSSYIVYITDGILNPSSAVIDYNNAVTITCATGYELTGPSTLTCVNAG